MSKHIIELSVRLRPLFTDEKPVISVKDGRKIVIQDKSFKYPSHIIEGKDQEIAYKALGERLVNALFEGYNCSLLAYGQTGSGKTYSMLGPPGSLTESALDQAPKDKSPHEWGVLPRIMLHLLNHQDLGQIHASAVEIYLDTAYDLLDNRKLLRVGGTRTSTTLQYIETKNDGSVKEVHPSTCTCFRCFNKNNNAKPIKSGRAEKKTLQKETNLDEEFSTSGETRLRIRTPADVAKMARTIEMTRTAQGHLLNARSSRSHCLVSLYVTKKTGSSVKETKFLFVDLAGSERINKSGVTGVRATEATCINSSLTTLGRVIKALAGEGDSKKHVPYRDSTLTMLLSSSFGGKSCTSVVINISSEYEHINETISSLQFGERLVKVRNTANVISGTDLKDEISILERVRVSIQHELSELEKNGKGAHFGHDVPLSEKKTFNENLSKHQTLEKEARLLQTEIAEMLGEGMEKGGVQHASLVTKLQNLKFQADNIGDIIARQKTIPNFWYPPTVVYVKKMNELKDVETKLDQLKN